MNEEEYEYEDLKPASHWTTFKQAMTVTAIGLFGPTLLYIVAHFLLHFGS